MDVARQARVEAGLTPDIPFAAYLPLVVHDDPEEALRIGAGQVSLFARFSTMYGTVLGPASDAQREVFGAIHENYDMHEHGRPGSAQAECDHRRVRARLRCVRPARLLRPTPR